MQGDYYLGTEGIQPDSRLQDFAPHTWWVSCEELAWWQQDNVMQGVSKRRHVLDQKDKVEKFSFVSICFHSKYPLDQWRNEQLPCVEAKSGTTRYLSCLANMQRSVRL
ncbi:hypothetical protein CAPTEDRAFT_205128 [Capitella teleta]|uniref:Uncharacterized protein n=1 Tax=Capitella teleta TaxID=283909 RepID=R7TZJ6_CAPTE|nr:hypothetical protein CAPTEDRAFT_205128 [Capitella teleta]|eukprot:ELT96796.1 hypothetical protein CAPTEDRAFT_205128 [Capitella teleta]